ncbi:MAG: hypothetical protein C0475_05825 [Planctomyces sp.]|nr:hypothetical protein [Planctomyces sp.]MBA4038937.1 hypothetical protein [Planctomyces sp.]MBA4119125.1 hypothetical protein [Isosphaera sp.]
MATLALTLAACLAPAAGMGRRDAAALAPEPAAVPQRWLLDVTFGPLRVAQLDDGTGRNRAFYYFTYKAVNNTGQDVLFAPSFELSTGAGQVVRSGRGIPSQVTQQIIERLDNPFLEDQIQVIGQLRQGQENAKEGVVVFEAPTLQPEGLTVYAAGFSGEFVTLALPTSTGLDIDGGRATLRRTRQLVFAAVGDLSNRGDQPIEVVEQVWIMR